MGGSANTEPDTSGSARRTPVKAVARLLVKLIIPLLALIALIALAATNSLPWQSPAHGSSAIQFPRNALVADFGVQRVSLTRTILVSTGTAAVATPTILTARLSSDLVETTRLGQFPADQITLTATPAGPRQVEIVAILNPVNPYKVADGLFTGSISVYTGTQVLSVPVSVYLAPKSGYHALLAFLLLLLGAIFGLSVKWVTEALSSLATARWRLTAILQAFRGSMGTLPLSVEYQLEEINDRINRQDLADLDGLFQPLETARGSLLEFSNRITNINDDIGYQQQLEKLAGLPVEAAIREEQRHVRALLSRPWPWRDDNEILREAQRLGEHVKDAGRAIEQRDSGVLSLYAADQFERAYERSTASGGGKPLDSAGTAAGASLPGAISPSRPDQVAGPPSPRDLRGGRERTLSDGKKLIVWMTERPRSLAAAASILVVAIVGLQLQYLNSTSFDGSLADWLSLLLWAAVIELSGVSVLDVVGRLSGGGPVPHRS